MAPQTLLLTCSSLLIISLHLFQTCHADSYCSPSACGLIRNISFPFRLNHDPKHCGDRRYELACENNVTFVYLNSQKFYVKEINYYNYIIRVVDASRNNDGVCSFPTYSASPHDFSLQGYYSNPDVDPPLPIHFMSCPHPLKNSSLFTDITADCASSNSSHPRFTYAKVGGDMQASEVTETCTIEVAVMTSWRGFKDLKNASLSEIHQSLLYGFELTFCGCTRLSSEWAWPIYHISCEKPLKLNSSIFPDITPFSDPLRLNYIKVGPMNFSELPDTCDIWNKMTSRQEFKDLNNISLSEVRHSLLYAFQHDISFWCGLRTSSWTSHKGRKLYIIIPLVVAFVCISIMVFIAWWLMVKRKGDKAKDTDILEAGQMFTTDSTAIVLRDESKEVNIGELPKFTFEMLANATNQFHENNLLGMGGFGRVYKGILANGKEIAVKRLSADSGQGMQEFMNEVIVISKLQHKNLVKLLGGYVEKQEKILIYEYMPNRSLDAGLFGPTNPTKKLLDWKIRYSVIEGVGRGILYLHRDSRLRIIHRDLKPSNVLLDQDWNPKISDFGMARIFGGNEDHGNTSRVMGTYGYMAPEYAMEGIFSKKSDVYSFGVLILEIIKGKQNTHYFNEEWSLSLIGYAWKMWSEGNGLSFVEESIVLASREMEEDMVRCIQIGLLCVQESPSDRPVIQIVLSMLSREIVELPAPKQPMFAENSSTPENQNGYSNNEITLTVLDGR